MTGFLLEPPFEFSAGAGEGAADGELPPLPGVRVALHRADALVGEQHVVQLSFLNGIQVREGLAREEHRAHFGSVADAGIKV